MKHYLMFGMGTLCQYDSLEDVYDFLTDNETGKIEYDDSQYKIFNHFPSVQEIQNHLNSYQEESKTFDISRLFFKVMGFGSIRFCFFEKWEEISNELNIGEAVFRFFPSQEEFENVCKDYDDYQDKLSKERQAKHDINLLKNRSYSGGKMDVYLVDDHEFNPSTEQRIEIDYDPQAIVNNQIEKVFDHV